MSSKPVLLLVSPGASGREPVLRRLLDIARIVTLAQGASDIARTRWADALVLDSIKVEGLAFEDAWDAVAAWQKSHPEPEFVFAGAMTYDEFFVELCSLLQERMGLQSSRFTPPSTAHLMRSKLSFREACRRAGIPTVRFAHLRTMEDVEQLQAQEGGSWPFPCVLKPTKGAGSWYMTKVDDFPSLHDHWGRLSQALADGQFPEEIKREGFVLEEFFDGWEVDVDGWAESGKLAWALVSDNKPAVEPAFLEMGGTYPSQLPAQIVAEIIKLTEQVLEALPGTHGTFHFEAKVKLGSLSGMAQGQSTIPDASSCHCRLMPIEFNGRTGGAECPASVEAVSGYYLPEVAASLALGLTVPRSPAQHAVVCSTNLHVSRAGVLTECNDRGVDSKANKVVTSVLFSSSVGKSLIPANGSMSCLGWLSAGGASEAEAAHNLQAAVDQLRVEVDGKEALPPAYTLSGAVS